MELNWLRLWVPQPNWRRELLYPGLATMESCWLYPWLALALGTSKGGRSLPFAAIVLTLLVAVYVTRLLSHRVIPLPVQRAVTVLLALLHALVQVKLWAYPDYGITQTAWLGRFLWDMGAVLQGIPPALIIFAASLYLWGRGIHLAQRELGFDSVCFSFRVGIIAFLWFFLIGVFGSSQDRTSYAFLYFGVGLIVVALARIEEVGQSRIGIRSPFGASWMTILVGSVVVVSAFGILAAHLFSLRSLAAFARRLNPVLALFGQVARPLLPLLAWFLDLVLGFFIRLFGSMLGAPSEELSNTSRLAEELLQSRPVLSSRGALWVIVQGIKWGSLALALLVALGVLAISISRRLQEAREGQSSGQGALWDVEGRSDNGREGAANRWGRWREVLQARLAELWGDRYSLASVRQIYASLVGLATAAGFPRRAAETPYEYIASLHKAFPASEKEIQLITEAYVQTHYGQRSFRSGYVGQVRAAWLAIRARQEEAAR